MAAFTHTEMGLQRSGEVHVARLTSTQEGSHRDVSLSPYPALAYILLEVRPTVFLVPPRCSDIPRPPNYVRNGEIYMVNISDCIFPAVLLPSNFHIETEET